MRRIVIFLSIVILTSCSDRITKNQLIGIYSWNNSQKGELTINSDLSYSYKFDLVQNDTIQNTGTWEFDSLKQEILFHDFRFSIDDKVKGIWISRVREKNQQIHLIYASDSDIYLKKNE